jgi:chitodextrinase
VIDVSVTDALGALSAPSTSRYLTVYGLPGVETPTTNRTSADVGQSVSFSTAGLGGDGVYRFLWKGLPSGCALIGNPIDCTMSLAGSFGVSVQVVDSNGGASAPSRVRGLTVYPDPSVTVALAQGALDQGDLLQLTATGLNGSGNLSFSWSGLPPGCPNGGAQVTCSTSAAPVRDYAIQATVTDSNGVSNISAIADLDVVADLSMHYPTFTTPAAVGQAIAFSVAATGGVAPLRYDWHFGDGARATGPAPSHAYSSPGRYTVLVWVNDSANASEERAVLVTVSAGSGGGAAGIPSWEIALPVGAAVAVAAAAFLVFRRQRRAAR